MESSEWTMCGTANSFFFLKLSPEQMMESKGEVCFDLYFGGVHRRRKARENIYI
jgi:hypothetical protein